MYNYNSQDGTTTADHTKNHFNGYIKTFTYTQMKVTFGKTHMAVQKNIDVPLLFTSSNY